MQSKISSSDHFSKALFVKNTKRLWPMWAVYSFIVFWVLYAQTFIELKVVFFSDYSHIKERTLSYIYTEATQSTIAIALVFAILFALGNFGYLGREKSCYFMHSLPLTRGGLYGSSFISGLLMMYVPNLVFFLLTNILCIQEGCNFLKPLSIWLLVISTEELFFYSMAVLALIIIGHNIAGTVLYGVMMFFSELIVILMNSIYANLYYGIGSELITFRDDFTCIVSPVRFFMRFYVYEDYVLDADGLPVYVTVNLWQVMLEALIFATVFIVLGLLLYRIRKSEHAGDVIAIDLFKPVFRWIFGISVALLITYLMIETLFYTWTKTTAIIPITFVLIMLFGVIAYIAAEMIIKKSFRVFDGFKGKAVIYTLCLAAGTAAMLGLGFKAAEKVPEAGKIKAAQISVYDSEYTFTDPEDIDKILKLHKMIVTDRDQLIHRSNSTENDSETYWTTLQINYYLNKRSMSRIYSLPIEDSELIKNIDAFCNEHTSELILGSESDGKITDANVWTVKNNSYSESVNLSPKETEALIAALKKDIESGYTDFKFLSDYSGFDIGYYDQSEYFILEFRVRYANRETNNYYLSGAFYHEYKRVRFDSKCLNAVKYLQSIDFDGRIQNIEDPALTGIKF